MAGDMRVGGTTNPKIKKSRKLWSLQDRSMMSIHLLKANLAEDGCDEAQLDVAKKLLNGDSNDVPSEAMQNENARLAIYWLIRSSEQGNEEATEHLTQCFESGKGITCQNILDVRSCIKTPITEKLTFKAARLLYEMLSNGEEFITTTQLLVRLESRKYEPKVTFGRSQRQNNESQGQSPHESFINSNRNRSKSQPGSTSTPDGTPPKSNFDPNATFIIASPSLNPNHNVSAASSEEDSFNTHSAEAEYFSSYRDQEGAKLTLDDLLKVASLYNKGQAPSVCINSKNKLEGKQEWGLSEVWSLLVLQSVVVAVCTGFTTQLHALFLGVTFFCLWSSYNFILWRKLKSNFSDWTEAFRSVIQQKTWNETSCTSKFERNYFRPYLGTNLMCLALFTLFDGQYTLKIVAGFLTIFGLIYGRIIRPFGIPAWQIAAVFSIQLLSNYISLLMLSLKELNILQLLDVDFTDWIYDSLPDIDIVPANFDVSILLQGLQVLLILHYFATKKHLFSDETVAEVLGASWVLRILQWTPLCSGYEEYSAVAGAVLLLALLFVCLDANVGGWKIIVGLGLTATLLLISYGIAITITIEEDTETPSTFLEWKDYERNCHRTAWRTQTMAETQINCLLKYDHSRVAWRGRVSLVNLHDYSKHPLANNLVNIVFELLLNAGVDESAGQLQGSGAGLWKWQNYLPIQGFHGSSKDTEALAPISVWISTRDLNQFQRESIIRHIFNFRTGDIIEFTGRLVGSIGGLKPEIGSVETLTCISCSIAEYGQVLLKAESGFQYWIKEAAKFYTYFSFPVDFGQAGDSEVEEG